MPEETAMMYWNFRQEQDIIRLLEFISGCDKIKVSLDLESCVIDFCFSGTDVGAGATIGTQAKVTPLSGVESSEVVFDLDDNTESRKKFAEYLAEQLKTDATVVKMDSIWKWNELKKIMATIVSRNPDVWEIVGPDENEDVLYYNMEVATRLGSTDRYSIVVDEGTIRKLVKAISITESAGFGISRYSKGMRLEFMIDIDSVYLDA